MLDALEQNVHQPGPAPAAAQPDVPAPAVNDVAPPTAPEISAPNPNVKPPSLWRSVLAGALFGLTHGGIPGAVKGAIDPKTAMDEKNAEARGLQNGVKFADLRSATAAAQLTKVDQDIHNEPEKMQQARDDHGIKLVTFARSLGMDYDAFPNTGSAAMQYVEQAHNASGGAGVSVPAGAVVTPSMIYVPKSTNSPESKFNVASKLGAAFGLPVPDKSLWARLKPDKQEQLLDPIMNQISGHGKDGKVLTGEALRNQLALFQARRDAYSNRTDKDDAVMAQMDDTLNLLKQQVGSQRAEKNSDQARKDASASNMVNQRSVLAKSLMDYRATLPTMQMRNTAAQARVATEGIPGVIKEINDLKDDLGPVSGRFNEFYQGKVGMDNPKLAGLRTDLVMVASAVALAHARGRLPENLRAEFDQMINAPKQTPENLTSVLNHIKPWMDRMEDVGRVPGGGAPNAGTRPTGATMKVPGSDGKLHWSDGHKDLGVAQ